MSRKDFIIRSPESTARSDLSERLPWLSVISRRNLLQAAATTGPLTLIPGDGGARQLGGDMGPYTVVITEADLQDDGTLVVSGTCDVPNPPKSVELHVQIRGDRGIRAIGDTTATCNHSEGWTDTFQISTSTRGGHSFAAGDDAIVCAKAQADPDDAPASVVRWCEKVTIG